MRILPFFLLLLAGCSSTVGKPPVPPHVPPAPVPLSETRTVARPVRPLDEAATKAWLDGEIERLRARETPPPQPAPGPETQLAPRETIVQGGYYAPNTTALVGYHYDQYGNPLFYDHGMQCSPRYRQSAVVPGAIIGGIAGRLSDNYSTWEGAAAGMGVGLLLDLLRF